MWKGISGLNAGVWQLQSASHLWTAQRKKSKHLAGLICVAG